MRGRALLLCPPGREQPSPATGRSRADCGGDRCGDDNAHVGSGPPRRDGSPVSDDPGSHFGTRRCRDAGQRLAIEPCTARCPGAPFRSGQSRRAVPRERRDDGGEGVESPCDRRRAQYVALTDRSALRHGRYVGATRWGGDRAELRPGAQPHPRRSREPRRALAQSGRDRRHRRRSRISVHGVRHDPRQRGRRLEPSDGSCVGDRCHRQELCDPECAAQLRPRAEALEPGQRLGLREYVLQLQHALRVVVAERERGRGAAVAAVPARPVDRKLAPRSARHCQPGRDRRRQAGGAHPACRPVEGGRRHATARRGCVAARVPDAGTRRRGRRARGGVLRRTACRQPRGRAHRKCRGGVGELGRRGFRRGVGRRACGVGRLDPVHPCGSYEHHRRRSPTPRGSRSAGRSSSAQPLTCRCRCCSGCGWPPGGHVACC